MVRKTKRNMEKLVTIIDQHPLASRPYTAQDGTQKVFNSRGFILDGIDEFYAEMTGDMAVAAGEYDTGVWHKVQGYMRQRSFQDKNGVTRYENQIFITKLI